MTAPIWATSRADQRRSSRAVNDCCSVGGIAWMSPCSPPRSRRRRVTSSDSGGTGAKPDAPGRGVRPGAS
jgi:hypothetical protein